MTDNHPAHEIRLGRIKAAIWSNEIPDGPRYNVTISRLFKDENGWRRSGVFGRDDLPIVTKVADLAHTWILDRSQDGDGQVQENPA